MAAKIFFLAFAVLLTIQGLNASSLSKRNVIDDLKGKLQDVVNDISDTANKVTEAAEEKARSTIQDAINKVKEVVENAKAVVKEALEKIKDEAKKIADKAKEVIDKVKNELSDLKDKAEAKISDFIEQLKTHGEGALSCAYNNRDEIASVIKTSGSNVIACTAAVQEKAQPIVNDAVETVARVVDLGTKATSIIATCIPAGATVVLAVPCVLLQTGLVLGKVVDDIKVITTDVKDIIERAPGLKLEVESCAADVKTAKLNVDNLLGNIKKCVDDYAASKA